MQSLDQWKQKFEAYLEEHPSKDGSHDLSHFQRVWRLADSFCSGSEDQLTILAACYFHDIVSYPKNDPRRKESSIHASQKAMSILSEMDFPKEKLEAVKHCIEAHSYSANIETKTLEAKIVQDADRTEALGAIGLARTFYVAGLMKTKLFCSEDPFATNRELDDKAYALDHFQQKLLKLPSTMKTEPARLEANKRANILYKFLDDLKNELYI